MMEGSMSIRASFQHYAKQYAGRGARNMLAAAGIGFIAATAVVAPGYAQQATQIAATSEITADTVCKNYRPGQFGQSAICEIKKGVVLDRQLAMQEQLTKCIDFLKQAKGRGATFSERITRENACPTAIRFGMPAPG
jgi:hypothetical protein